MHAQGAMSSLAQECSSPDSRGSSSHALDSPMRGNPVCRICDEVVSIWYCPVYAALLLPHLCTIACSDVPAQPCQLVLLLHEDFCDRCQALRVKGSGQGMCTRDDV